MAPRVLIVGAGFGGVAAAIELQRHGITDIEILDRAPEAGGTWFWNTYPGAACDVPSHFYSFSYDQRTDWERLCPMQDEILVYLRDVIRKQGIDRLITHDVTVTGCAWDDDARRWTVTAGDGRSFDGDVLILATGQLHQPQYPAIPGAESFAGHTFHSARWDHDYDLRGKNVAVVGTGASAVQFVPEIAGVAKRLTVFQRTGNWFLPRKNRPYPGIWKALVKRVPGLQAWRRKYMFYYCESLTLSIRHPRTLGRFLGMRAAGFMRMQLKDPVVREKAWPDYTFGCKRVLFSSNFLPTLQRPDVDLVTERIDSMREGGIVTSDGKLHEADCVIWATGFKTNDFMFPMEVTGAGGRDLRAEWAGGAHAHLGITVPGFPSMFVMYGPNTNTSGGSIILYLEAQARYLRQAIQAMSRNRAAAIDVRPEVEKRSADEVQERFRGTAWTACDSWYRTENGRIVANWPGTMKEYLEETERLDPSEYEFLPR
jgi:cation diffusion facilitator CzcD-associated flavoprotein CzcO